MSYQEREKTRLKRQASKEAVATNKKLLESYPSDVDTYNRLGRAYMELGEYSLAKESYQKAIELDPYNTIARKNFHRLSHLTEEVVSSRGSVAKVEPQQFIEEEGKAGVVSLYRLAPPEVLAKTVAG